MPSSECSSRIFSSFPKAVANMQIRIRNLLILLCPLTQLSRTPSEIRSWRPLTTTARLFSSQSSSTLILESVPRTIRTGKIFDGGSICKLSADKTSLITWSNLSSWSRVEEEEVIYIRRLQGLAQIQYPSDCGISNREVTMNSCNDRKNSKLQAWGRSSDLGFASLLGIDCGCVIKRHCQ